MKAIPRPDHGWIPKPGYVFDHKLTDRRLFKIVRADNIQFHFTMVEGNMDRNIFNRYPCCGAQESHYSVGNEIYVDWFIPNKPIIIIRSK